LDGAGNVNGAPSLVEINSEADLAVQCLQIKRAGQCTRSVQTIMSRIPGCPILLLASASGRFLACDVVEDIASAIFWPQRSLHKPMEGDWIVSRRVAV